MPELAGFGYLLWPPVWGTALFLLSGLISLFQRRMLPDSPQPIPATPDGGGERRRRLGAGAALARRLLSGAAGIVLVAGLLALLPRLPDTISAQPGAPDLAFLNEYVAVLGSLAVWTVAVLGLLVMLRSARAIWPWLGEIFGFPRIRLALLAMCYVVFSGSGVLAVAFGYSGWRALPAVALVLFLPYLASVLRGITRLPMQRRLSAPLRVALLAADCGWIALLLAVVAAIPGVVEAVPTDRFGGVVDAAPYLPVLDSLVTWAIILVAPFIVPRAIGSFWNPLATVFTFPLGRLVLLGGVFVLFSAEGVLATALEFPGDKVLFVLTLALGLSYLGSVLGNFSRLHSGSRVAALVTNLCPVAGVVPSALPPAMAVWAGLDSLPLVSAQLLDHRATEGFAERYLPYFSLLFDARVPVAAGFFAGALAASLPRPLWPGARLHLRPLFAAAAYVAAGCLAWSVGSGLAPLGHGYPFAGAMMGLGLVFLGLASLATYLVSSSNPAVADSALWLSRSKARGFLIGTVVAFYGLMLRPLFYEAMWFAPLYEFLMLLAVIAFAALKLRVRVATDVAPVETGSPDWAGWDRHQQSFESRPDPRWELMSGIRGRFVENGEWGPLWDYLMGLLFRNQAPLEAASAVFRPLRASGAARGRRGPRRALRRRERPRREAALAQSFRTAERFLGRTPSRLDPVDEDAVREAAAPFIETGADPEYLAAVLAAGYWQRGAELERSVRLWFPLANRPGQTVRWFHPPWAKARRRFSDRQRRLELVEGAIAHLSGEAGVDSLPVVIPDGPLTVFPHADGQNGSAVPLATLEAGQGVELVSEEGPSWLVRGPENIQGYVSKSELRRQPILPTDEVKVAQ